MKNLLKCILIFILLATVYFACNKKTKIKGEDYIVKDSLEPIQKSISECYEVDMKWASKSSYISYLFVELNRLKGTENLEELLPNKDNIKILKINSQNLRELPKELFVFTKIEQLDISDNPFLDLKKLIYDLSRFPKLRILAMSHCGIEKLPDNISLLQNLEGLALDQNIKMTEVNENIGLLTNLRYLNFRRNKRLKDLPKTIGNLKCLEQIVMSGAGFIRIREELAYCTNLKNITANASKIKELPHNLGRLKNLRLLNLGYNMIEFLPESIGELEQLDDLSLGSNEISFLPNSISKLENLDALSLEYNRFKIFPKQILNLKKLRLLCLHNNSIQRIPIEITRIPGLSLLYVDHEVISDGNIKDLKISNPNLEVKRHDALRRAPQEPKRKL